MTSTPRNGGGSTQFREYFFDDGLHEACGIRSSDNLQALDYPIFPMLADLFAWHMRNMVDEDFDPELVKAKMAERKVTQAALARLTKMPSQSAMSNVLKGKRRVSTTEAKIIYDYLGIKRNPQFKVVPVIGITSAGNWREAIELPIGYMPIPPGVGSDSCFGLEVSGDSMNVLIEDGGWVLIDPAEKELRDGKAYLICNGENEATVKQYRRSPARFESCSTNPDHIAFMVEDTEFRVLGRVIWKGSPV